MNTPSRPASSLSLSQQTTPTKQSHTSVPAANGISVQVALRIRPPPAPEDEANVPVRFQRAVVHPIAGSNSSLSVDNSPPSATATPKAGSKQIFTYDRVFGPTSSQTEIYDDVLDDLVKRFVEGYNVTCLAYGQTSAGKSYTMGTDYTPDFENNTEEANRIGIIPRAIAAIFRQLASAGVSFHLRNSYIELYNEDLIDLLATNATDRPQVTIREDKAGHIIWTGLREIKVENVQDVMSNLATGSSVRQTSSTDMNAQSSRSHAVFSLTLVQNRPVMGNTGVSTPVLGARSRLSTLPRPSSPINRGDVGRSGIRPPSSMSMLSGRDSPGPSMLDERRQSTMSARANGETLTITSKFHFVDLAGSERLKRTSAVGERVKEGISINSGLHALGNVISALGDPNRARSLTHIPYRDSKLTRLLQDSLGGNARTLMIACVDAREYNLNETLNTLKYANRARNIKNTATINEIEEGWDDIEHLQEMVLRLRADLLASRQQQPLSGVGPNRIGTSDPSALLTLQDQYSELSLRHAKMTADLAKQGTLPVSDTHHDRLSRASLSPQDFATAVEPVVEEYEKSLSALESQLSLTRAALSHTEDALREQEAVNEEGRESVQAQNDRILELESRLAKIGERESSTEAYLRDLEAKLLTQDGQEDAQNNIVTALRNEISKRKENEETSERYIKDLERRLADIEQNPATKDQQAGTEVLGRTREAQSDASPARERALSQSAAKDIKALLAELQAKDGQIHTLQTEMERLRIQSSAESGLSDNAKDDQEVLHAPIAESQVQVKQRDNSAVSYDSTRGNGFMNGSSADPEGSEDTLRARYDRSVAQVHVLSLQLASAKAALQQQNGVSPSSLDTPPASPMEAFGPSQEDNNVEILANLPPRSASRSSTTVPLSPKRSRKSLQVFGSNHANSPASLSGNEMRQSLNGRTGASQPTSQVSYPPESLSATSLRRSASLSQDWHSALISPNFKRKTSIARSASPTPSRDSFLLPNPSSALPISDTERGVDSFLKEIAQLQEVIQKREDEIRVLEARTGLSSLTTNGEVNGDGLPLSVEESSDSVKLHATMRNQRTDSGASSRPQKILVDRDTEMDDLLRSMARKETAHTESMSKLTSEYEALLKEHEALQSVSKNQVLNMSQEIESLNTQLHALAEDNIAATEKLSLLEEQFAVKQDEVEAAKVEVSQHLEDAQTAMRQAHQTELLEKAEEHARVVSAMQAEHAEFLGRLVQEREQLFVSRAEEFERSTNDQQKRFEVQLESLREIHALETEKQTTLSKEQIASLEAQCTSLNEQMAQLQSATSSGAADLKSEMQHQNNTSRAEIERLLKEVEEQETLRKGLQDAAALHSTTMTEMSAEIAALKKALDMEQQLTASLKRAPPLQREISATPNGEIFVDAPDYTPANVLTTDECSKGILDDSQISKSEGEIESLASAKLELKEALEALAAIEKSLLESEREREQMQFRLTDLNEQSAAFSKLENDMADMAHLLGQLEKELGVVNAEKELLASKQSQTENLLKEMEKKYLEATRTTDSPDLARSPSTGSSRNGHSSTPPMSLTMKTMSARFSQSSTLPKSPPKAPPPSSSLPPLPTALPPIPSMASLPESSSPSSANAPKQARDSTLSVSTLDGISLDPRVQKRIDEQDIQMGKLVKQLNHAEADLKANIDLVNTLEGALNDTEKSLRKARMQINDYAKDRDSQAKAKDMLRGQLVQANEELKQMRERLATVTQNDTRLAQERAQKDQARAQLEQRLADLQTRKSKFACF